MHFFVRDWTMLDASRHNYELAFADDGLAVAKFHAQSPLDPEEQFVLDIMMMPHELAFELHRFDLAIVHFSDDLRAEVFRETAKFLFQIYSFHGGSYGRAA